ncbi:MAG: Crp/Fnr family transcriptional regulator [Catalinimonas sp.]
MPTKEALLAQLEAYYPQFEPALRTYLVEWGSWRTVPSDVVMLQPGQEITAVTLVLGGRVKLYRTGDDGAQFFMYDLPPGGACALTLMCAVRHERSRVMAVTEAPTELLAVPTERMAEMMRRFPTWNPFVVATYRARFEELLDMIDAVAFKQMDERLLYYLTRRAASLDTRTLPLTHQQIADDLNTSREVVSRLLKKLEVRREITLGRGHVILHPDG